MDRPERDDADLAHYCDGLAPGGAAAYGAGGDVDESDLDDHGADGLCGEDYIGGCFI